MQVATRPGGPTPLIEDLLAHWLTGAVGAEVTNASTTGFLDATSRQWAAS